MSWNGVLVQVWYMKVGCFTIFIARSFSPFIPKTSKTCKNRMFLDTPNIQNLYLSWVSILNPCACSPKPGGNDSLWHLSAGKPMISTRKWYTHGGVSISAVRGWRVYRRVLFMGSKYLWVCPKLDTRNQQGMERSIEPNGTISRQNYVHYFTNPKQGDLGN